MSTYVRFCENCASKDLGMKSLYGRYSTFYNENDYTCEVCGNQIFDTQMKSSDYKVIVKISNDPKFVNEMFKLLEKDIIEYNLKMSQFRSQVEQQKSAESNQVHCPKCGSTSVTTGARGVNMVWGLIGASKTVNRCAKCGYTWKP